jgi:hypothetical protein
MIFVLSVTQVKNLRSVIVTILEKYITGINTLNKMNEEILFLLRENNKMLKDIWMHINRGTPNDDLKDFIINVIANKISNRNGI